MMLPEWKRRLWASVDAMKDILRGKKATKIVRDMRDKGTEVGGQKETYGETNMTRRIGFWNYEMMCLWQDG